MTIDERLDRIEHVTAGIAEQLRIEREENRVLWRRTQDQLDALAGQVSRVTIDMDRLILEAAARDQASFARDERLGERIDKLVSAIGEFIAGRRAES